MNKVFHYCMRASCITLESLFNNGPSRVVYCSLQDGGDDNDLYSEISIIYSREFWIFFKRPKAWAHRPPGNRGPSEGLGALGGRGPQGPKAPRDPQAPQGPRAPWGDGPRPWAHHPRGLRVLRGSGDTAVCPRGPAFYFFKLKLIYFLKINRKKFAKLFFLGGSHEK